MTVVKAQSRHAACARSKGIQWYIEQKTPGRCIARDFLNVRDCAQDAWAAEFDRTRMIEGNHLPHAGRRAVQYVHIEISPDPRDGAGPDEVLAFAREWAAHWFGSGFEAGKLGCFQVAIGIHDDNEGGIVHAHVVVNNTDLLTGKRLHAGRKEAKGYQNLAQDMARERGWHYFDNTPDKRWIAAEKGKPYTDRRAMTPNSTPPTIAERRMRERGVAPWKDDIRTAVEAARTVTVKDADARMICSELGVDARRRADGETVYEIERDGVRHAALGRSIGFPGSIVEGRRTDSAYLTEAERADFRKRILEAFRNAKTITLSDSEVRGRSEYEVAMLVIRKATRTANARKRARLASIRARGERDMKASGIGGMMTGRSLEDDYGYFRKAEASNPSRGRAR